MPSAAKTSATNALPTSRKLIEQLLLIYDGKDLYELVNREFQRGRVTLSLNVHGANEISQVIDRIRAHLAAQPIAGVADGSCRLRPAVLGSGRPHC